MYKFLLTCLILSGFIQAMQTDLLKESFTGIYSGIEIGKQNIFGGSFVNGVDILAQDSRSVTDLVLGGRIPLYQQFRVGAELHYGFTDGDLYYRDAEKQIKYSNSKQYSYGINLGYVISEKFYASLYANETKRNFAVEIHDQGDFYRQSDKQGMIRYGFGLEYKLYKVFNLRGSIGKIHANFHELITNIDAGNGTDFMIGIVYKFE